MLNLSKQFSDDGVSMYLSFDNSSTMSESTYKTLAGDEVSDIFDLLENNENNDSKGNTTLEPEINITSPTLNDATDSSEGTVPLSYPFTKVLREHNVLSSTPSKNETSTASKSGTTELSSQTSDCMTANESLQKRNLSAVFDNLVAKYEQVDSKENELPDLSDDSLPSFSKTSLIELKKQNEILVTETETEVLQRLLSEHPDEKENKCENNANENNNDEDSTSKSTTEKEKEKLKIKQSSRKSVCEPSLLTNRPSRIVPKKKARFTLGNVRETSNVVLLTQPSSNRPVQQKAPIVLSHININTEGDKEEKVNVRESKNNEDSEFNGRLKNKAVAGVSRKSLAAPKATASATRRSVAHNLQPDKRPIAVKTTLNSATRKQTYRMSMANGGTVAKRRSVLLLQSKIASPLSRSQNSASSQGSSASDQAFRPRTAGGDEVAKRIQTKRSETLRKTMFIEKPHDTKFACTECGQSYNVRSLLDAHKKTHQTENPEVPKRSPYTMSTSVGMSANNPANSLNAQNHKCKYCDKGFVLERALHIHLMEHCLKIPAIERRKLDFTEMNHVEKAETPHFRAPKKFNIPKAPETNREPIIQRMLYRKAGGVANSTGDAKMANKKHEFFTKKNSGNPARKIAEKYSPRDDSDEAQMPPPSAKMKKKSAHAGIYRTPNKDIDCRSCKQSFKSILDYTNHMMSMHSSLSDSNNSLDA